MSIAQVCFIVNRLRKLERNKHLFTCPKQHNHNNDQTELQLYQQVFVQTYGCHPLWRNSLDWWQDPAGVLEENNNLISLHARAFDKNSFCMELPQQKTKKHWLLYSFHGTTNLCWIVLMKPNEYCFYGIDCVDWVLENTDKVVKFSFSCEMWQCGANIFT